jgi:hypothetical protein
VPERIAVVGCRDPIPTSVARQVISFVTHLPVGTTVVTGDASGVDMLARWSTRRAGGLHLIEHVADWAKHGKRAGPLRNAQIVASCDRMVAFWDGESRGTADSIRQCRAAGKKVDVRLFARHATG